MKQYETFFEWVTVCIKKRISPADSQGYWITHKKRKLRNEIIQYYKMHPTADNSINEALNYLKKSGFQSPYPYPFRNKYKIKDLRIRHDDSGQPFYTFPNGKRLFLKRTSDYEAARIMNELLIEQDTNSPHRYFTSDFKTSTSDILADVGCAEGILSLMVIDQIEHAYLFECDEEWIEALQKTFAPWKEKVTIIQGYVSKEDGGNSLTLSSFFKNQPLPPTFIKLDVEGYEMDVMLGMKELWQTPDLRIAVCTYHNQNDAADFTMFLEKKSMVCHYSNHYMIMSLDEYQPPYFRRGLIRATARK